MRGLNVWEREVVRWILTLVVLILPGLIPADQHSVPGAVLSWGIWILGLVIVFKIVGRLPLKTDVLLARASEALEVIARRPETHLAERAAAALREIGEGGQQSDC